MSEIVYFWLGGKKAVAVSSDVQLPQFHVLGYRQRYRVIELTTGMRNCFVIQLLNFKKMNTMMQ